MPRSVRPRGVAALTACQAVVPAQSASVGTPAPWRTLAAGPAPASNSHEGFIPYRP
jgi:hypothetical protein